MVFIIHSKKIFEILTPNILKNLYIKYSWLENIYFYLILMTFFMLLIFSMYFFRKCFERKCLFVFEDNLFTFSINSKEYIIETKNIIKISCLRNVTILPGHFNPNYYKIIIYTEKEIIKINTQIIKSMDSILNTSRLIEKLKEYYEELKVIDNTAFFGIVNKRIK
jgi:hypothetical protein